uniref:Major facilitator superfamily (MFS) profile domain-containing protein n=1 Tax=Hordeum vulgare subsp. vulgare TaxID=112509 RepID=A0A8I7B7Q3_HORVV
MGDTTRNRHGNDNDDATAPPSPPETVYYEGCPGCAMERKKENSTGTPYKEFFYVGVTTFASALPISSLFPFLYFMIQDMHVAKNEQDIGVYAGLLGASYMIGRCFASLFWGVVADRIGRKPIIAFSMLSVVIFNTLFGLSVKYWMAIATRMLLGSLNGMLAPIKAYSVEVCRPEHHALGLSVVSTGWGIGLVVGPAIGGYLAQPAKQYPGLFSEKSLFGRFPYLLPCLFISLIAFAVLISCIWLPETLHMHKNLEREVEMSGDSRVTDPHREVRHPEKKSLYKNWPLMSSIIAYCVFTLHDTAYSEIFSLWAVSDKKYGGLSFSSKDVGQVLAASGSIHTTSCYIPLHDTLIWDDTWTSYLFRCRYEGYFCHDYLNWYLYSAKQCCVTKSKRCCKWNIYDCNVPLQGYCSSWSRCLVLMGPKAPTCCFLSRGSNDISDFEYSRSNWACANLQAIPSSSKTL